MILKEKEKWLALEDIVLDNKKQKEQSGLSLKRHSSSGFTK
jgi:hypothetical protein